MSVDLFVNGTLMRGLALHANLAGADFLEVCQTAPSYRLYSIGDVHPGMFEVDEGGVTVAGEMYRVPDDVLERSKPASRPNLYRGPVRLSDGRLVDGILYPARIGRGHPARYLGLRRLARLHRTRKYPLSVRERGYFEN